MCMCCWCAEPRGGSPRTRTVSAGARHQISLFRFLYIASTSVVVKIGILEPKEMTLCFGRLVPRVNPQLARLYTKYYLSFILLVNNFATKVQKKLPKCSSFYYYSCYWLNELGDAKTKRIDRPFYPGGDGGQVAPVQTTKKSPKLGQRQQRENHIVDVRIDEHFPVGDGPRDDVIE
ncbi:hypothetical protein OUZ56_015710 [Daphnia magna]|uniref:Uncharacterized protein n=1 Tax=Daphnia magna TaxID=35525 RepID=A0ABR0AP00_9CRUS|nr:hypothetical protein OUZ56_015710 [Daphnia magna]